MGGWVRTENIQRPVPFPRHVYGRYYQGHGATALTTLVVTANILYAVPIYIPAPKVYTNIAIEVTATHASNARLGIYRDSAGAPGALLVDAGQVSVNTTLGRGIGIAVWVDEPGWYWLAVLFSGTPTVRALNRAGGAMFLGFAAAGDTNPNMAVSVAQAFGALPDPFTGGSALLAGNSPRILISPGAGGAGSI